LALWARQRCQRCHSCIFKTDRVRRASYHYWVFTTWFLEQQDRTDEIGKVARVCYSDYNAGCAMMYRDPIGWAEHFKSSHSKHYENVKSVLGDAYLEYIAQSSVK